MKGEPFVVVSADARGVSGGGGGVRAMRRRLKNPWFSPYIYSLYGASRSFDQRVSKEINREGLCLSSHFNIFEIPNLIGSGTFGPPGCKTKKCGFSVPQKYPDWQFIYRLGKLLLKILIEKFYSI